jgi:formimidoylglutamate deiminase
MYIHYGGRYKTNSQRSHAPDDPDKSMTVLHARTALLPKGWHHNVRLTVENGAFFAVDTDCAPQAGDERFDVLLPGMPNLHSHAFQRGMAGLTEKRGLDADSFWSWRSLMYRFALTMTPHDVQSVAAQLYMEMLEAGFTRVGEFHYLHHDTTGAAYCNIAEMAERIAAAAKTTHIRMTLLPVFYAHSGFGGKMPNDGQRRFICDIDDYSKLLDASKAAVKSLSGSVVGMAPHSLRAVTPDELKVVIDLAKTNPIHMHIAEQTAEVADCIAWSGARPIAWLLDHADVDARWCLIHATHMTPSETRRMAKTGAIAGLCPITEANLGDGIFAGKDFQLAGGRFGIGSDSNILIGIADELRQLEYSQRLQHHVRNMIVLPEKSTGRALFDSAFEGGVAALQGGEAGLAVGGPADCVSLNISGAPYLAGDAILDSWIFANAAKVDCVWTAGIKRVEKGRHFARDHIARDFTKTMQTLLAR